MTKSDMLKAILQSGQLEEGHFIDHSFISFRYKELVGGGKIKLQNRKNKDIAPTIKTQITNYGIVVRRQDG